MADFYKLNLLGITRELPILPTPSGIMIAGFNPVGDSEVIDISAKYLADKLNEQNIKFDVILTTELKGIPISQELARIFKTDYVALRKSKKCYMLDPISTSGNSITSGKSEYFVSSIDMNKLRGKKILFADDVFSTGSTFKSIETFAKNENLNIVAATFILKEVPKGEETSALTFKFNNTKIICSGVLPLQ